MAIYKDLVRKISVPSDKKIKQKEYLGAGTLPIVDQGHSRIGGYTDDVTKAMKCDYPVIVFGDHTKCVKFITFPFAPGADGIKVLKPKEGILPKYLYYGTKYLTFRIEDKGYARHYQYLEKKELAVPSLPEQQRIVSQIEELFSKLDASVAELQMAKKKLKVYRQAVLQEAFLALPDKSDVMLESIAEKIFDGPFGSNLKTSDYVESGVRVVRLENLKHGWFDNSKKSFVSTKKYEELSKHTVYPSDLVISTFISGTIKVCQIPKSVGNAINKADCVVIRLKEKVSPQFVMYYLMTKKLYETLIHQVHGATRPRINTKQIKSIRVPNASFCDQLDIVNRIQHGLSICDNIEQTIDSSLQKTKAMRQSILKRAFEGRL